MNVAALPPTPPDPDKHKKHNWLHDVTGGELLTTALKLNPGELKSGVDAFRGIGRTIEGAWSGLSHDIEKVLDLPLLSHHLSAETKQDIIRVISDTAQGIGYGAAGVSVAAGAFKLHEKKGDAVTKLAGLGDIATGGAIATTVAGLSLAPMILIPLASSFGAIRGTLNVFMGIKKGDGRQEVQGALDETRSLGTIASHLNVVSPVLSTVGTVLSGAAGGIQIVRGLVDLERGLKAHNDSKEFEGLTDLGIAAGSILAATGFGIIPGVALTVLAVASRLVYAVSKPVHAKVDKSLDKHQDGLQHVVDDLAKLGKPFLTVLHAIVHHLPGAEEREARNTAEYDAALNVADHSPSSTEKLAA